MAISERWSSAAEAFGGEETKEQLEEDNLTANMRVAIPAIVQAYYPETLTVDVQPAIKEWVSVGEGVSEASNLPLLVDCPVCFPQGGGFMITFPIKPGDECLIIFADMCINSWWQNGCKGTNGEINPQTQEEIRRHDLSDGMAIFGMTSVPNVGTIDNENMTINGSGTILIKDLNIVTINDQLQELRSVYNSHTHSVTVGGTIYTTTSPNQKV